MAKSLEFPGFSGHQNIFKIVFKIKNFSYNSILFEKIVV